MKKILSVVIICGIGIYFFNKQRDRGEVEISKDYFSEVLPVDESISFLKKDSGYIYLNEKKERKVNYKKVTKLSQNYLKVLEEKEFLINKKNEKVVLPEFETIENISEDRYVLLKKDGNFFYYDLLEKEVVTGEYEGLGVFKEDRAHFVKDGKLGFLDKNGVEIIKNIYPAVGEFTNGYAIVLKGDSEGYSVIDKFGTEILKGYDYIKIHDDGVFFLKSGNKNMMKVNDQTFETEDLVLNLGKGFYLFSKEGIHRVFSAKDQIFKKEIEGKYLGLSKDNILVKRDKDILVYNFIGESERTLNYDGVDVYDENYIIGNQNGKTYLYSKDGKSISKGVDLIYPEVFDKFIIGEETGYGVLAKDGREILESKYDGIQLTPNYIVAEEKEQKGLFDGDGKKLLDIKYEDIQCVDKNIYVLDKNGWRYVLLN